MKTPIVTIGVCVRNNASTIRETIESIKAQDFPLELTELIVVDGQSEDETLDIIRESLEKAVIKSKFFSEHNGLGYARQIVVDNAEGKYIVWVDGDMILSKNFVSILFKFIDSHPEMGIVKGKQALEPGENLLATLEGYSRVAGKMVDFTSKKAVGKVLGTSGCIYRTEAIRQAGGFDRNLKGYCEDWDAELKMRATGWLLGAIDARYLDYERHQLTWKNLWRRYWLRGYHTHYFLHKKPGIIKHYRMFPPAGFLVGLLQSRVLFKLTRQKKVFLLPFQNVFKLTAWYVGFFRSHRQSYQPRF
ncbi:MAG: glycosyltransferase family 2 protein [Candidatus Bathyarchaeota archaeon]|nr:glycosyltransferase family 2 protein [Candidatus Bathyarchaeota archaeon]